MSDFESATGKVNDLLANHEKMMNHLRDTLRASMKDIFKAFFETYPTVKTIHWTQYAPYFNDGDECVFSVHEPYFTTTEYDKLTDRSYAWGEEDDGTIVTRRWDREARKYVTVDIDPNLVRDMDKLATIIQSDANEDIFRAMFGNHVWVKAHRDGFYVDDYDHD